MAFIVREPSLPIENTSAALIATNPIFLKGQVIFETDTNRSKLGDGVTAYNSLSYSASSTYYTVASGTDTYVATFTIPLIISYFEGMTLLVKFTNANTGASTINVNALGAKTIQKQGVALPAGYILAGAINEIVYDGTVFQIINQQ